MKFGFVVKHRGIWPVRWLCEALGVSRSGFHAWLTRTPSIRTRSDEVIGAQIKASFVGSDRTYGARRIWHDVLAEGAACGLHRIERLMREQALRARPRRRGLPSDKGTRNEASDNVLDRQFEATAPNQKWIADFTYIWTAEGWLYMATVIYLFGTVGISVFAINPKQLDRFRDRFSPAGAKDDRRDALVLASSLRTDRHCFRRVEAMDPVVSGRAWLRNSSRNAFA